MKRMVLLGLIFALGFSAVKAGAADNALKMSKITLSAKVDLGDVTITYHITPENRSANVGVQIYAHRDDLKGREQWDQIPIASILNLFQGEDNTGSLVVHLPKGTYGDCRLLFFRSPDGKSTDFGQLLYDSAQDPAKPTLNLHATVRTVAKRVTKPVLETIGAPEVAAKGDGSYTVRIRGIVKVPQGYTTDQNGLWAMAKGEGFFSQIWIDLNKLQPGNNPDDTYNVLPIQFSQDNVKLGLWNVQFGLFKASFGDPLEWIYPGTDYEAGDDGWEKRAPEAKIPPRLRVRDRHFETVARKPYTFYPDEPAAMKAVSFVRGGNYGNAIAREVKPALDTPGFFILLKGIGLRFCRFNFDADRFLEEAAYQHAVDQVVQNIWAAGMYPIISPQDLPKGDSREEQVEKGLKVVRAMARIYANKSVWLEICNEPHAFGTWKEWKPVATRYVKAIRAIDPEAFVIVPFEGYSKDARGAAADPITEGAVDLYDGHAYVKPEEVATLYSPAIKAGLPLMIGEYGGGADYLGQMDQALQNLPGLMAAGPWAFTIAGEDSLPLVVDGSTAELRLTPAGLAIAADYAQWAKGQKRAP